MFSSEPAALFQLRVEATWTQSRPRALSAYAAAEMQGCRIAIFTWPGAADSRRAGPDG